MIRRAWTYVVCRLRAALACLAAVAHDDRAHEDFLDACAGVENRPRELSPAKRARLEKGLRSIRMTREQRRADIYLAIFVALVFAAAIALEKCR